jgi:hypothetical protein
MKAIIASEGFAAGLNAGQGATDRPTYGSSGKGTEVVDHPGQAVVDPVDGKASAVPQLLIWKTGDRVGNHGGRIELSLPLADGFRRLRGGLPRVSRCSGLRSIGMPQASRPHRRRAGAVDGGKWTKWYAPDRAVVVRGQIAALHRQRRAR